MLLHIYTQAVAACTACVDGVASSYSIQHESAHGQVRADLYSACTHNLWGTICSRGGLPMATRETINSNHSWSRGINFGGTISGMTVWGRSIRILGLIDNSEGLRPRHSSQIWASLETFQ